jgi:hypothetical protein
VGAEATTSASSLVNCGKVKEALSLLEQVVKMKEQTLAEDHPDRLASQQCAGKGISSEWTCQRGGSSRRLIR